MANEKIWIDASVINDAIKVYNSNVTESHRSEMAEIYEKYRELRTLKNGCIDGNSLFYNLWAMHPFMESDAACSKFSSLVERSSDGKILGDQSTVKEINIIENTYGRTAVDRARSYLKILENEKREDRDDNPSRERTAKEYNEWDEWWVIPVLALFVAAGLAVTIMNIYS